jgi:hypothetical protein
MGLLPKGRPDGSTFLLDNRPFVSNGLGGPDVADELLHWKEGGVLVRPQEDTMVYW